MLTSSGSGNTTQLYYAYGRKRAGDSLPTDRTFTGQVQDGSGLVYMNARYYDPQSGQFISPDTLVPDAGNLFDYNRYMYARANPLKYSDPTGHFSEEQLNWLGVQKRDVSGNVWELLLKLEPTDRIYGDGIAMVEVTFGLAIAGDESSVGLMLKQGGEYYEEQNSYRPATRCCLMLPLPATWGQPMPRCGRMALWLRHNTITR